MAEREPTQVELDLADKTFKARNKPLAEPSIDALDQLPGIWDGRAMVRRAELSHTTDVHVRLVHAQAATEFELEAARLHRMRNHDE